MKHILKLMLLLLIFKLGVSTAQETFVTGMIFESLSIKPVYQVRVYLEGVPEEVYSKEDGSFNFGPHTLPMGPAILVLDKPGYLSKRIPITLTEQPLDLNPLYMEFDWQGLDVELDLISLTDDALAQADDDIVSVPDVLQASQGVFESAIAYDFSAAFFRPRGLDNSHNRLFINGFELNSHENGRPLWNLIGGLNEVQRNRESERGFSPHHLGFGSLGGSSYFTMRASRFNQGGSVSYATSNSTYRSRLMASYHSGNSPNGIAYSFLVSKRFAKTGYIEGTAYDASGFFMAMEKVFKKGGSVNLMALFAPIQRGRSAPLTQEVLTLKGTTYNPNWGFQNGRKRNSRVQEYQQPVFVLSHYGSLGSAVGLENHVGFTFGEETISRIDNAGLRNPYPHYYQRLPSYFLRNPAPSVYDFQQAYWAREALETDGQLDWESLYEANFTAMDSIAKYVLMQDVSRNRHLQVKTVINSTNNEKYEWMASLDYTLFRTEKYAQIQDMLGAANFLDIDAFYDGDEEGFEQSDSRNPNKLVRTEQPYKYHFKLGVNRYRGNFQVLAHLQKTRFYFGVELMNSHYWREGLFRNGYFQEGFRSFGKSKQLTFFTYTLKGGLAYRWNGRHETNAHFWYGTNPPLLRNSFGNVRQSNDVIHELASEQHFMGVLTYRYTGRRLHFSLSNYYAFINNATELGFFFTQNALGLENNSAFVQEIVQEIGRKQFGLEGAIKYEILSGLSIKAAVAYGNNLFSKNPTVYLAGDDFDYDKEDGYVEGNDLIARGKRIVFLKNYHQGGGPEQAFQIGFEYRDPDYWWMGVTANHFSKIYVTPSKLRRSQDFMLDVDGLPYAIYDSHKARKLLEQEQLQDFMIVNLVGGKSWKVNSYYVGVFASVSNILNQSYRTGGFEDSRYGSYPQQLEEQERPGGALFGNRYFLGYGTTYFLSMSIRF